MGGRGSFLTLHQIMAAYEAERQSKPDLTPHDFIVESSDEIAFRIADSATRAQWRQERENKAEVAAFVAGLPAGHVIRVAWGRGGGERPLGHVGREDAMRHPQWPATEKAVCGAPVWPLKRPEHATAYEICGMCRDCLAGPTDHSLAPALGSVQPRGYARCPR